MLHKKQSQYFVTWTGKYFIILTLVGQGGGGQLFVVTRQFSWVVGVRSGFLHVSGSQ